MIWNKQTSEQENIKQEIGLGIKEEVEITSRIVNKNKKQKETWEVCSGCL